MENNTPTNGNNQNNGFIFSPNNSSSSDDQSSPQAIPVNPHLHSNNQNETQNEALKPENNDTIKLQVPDKQDPLQSRINSISLNKTQNQQIPAQNPQLDNSVQNNLNQTGISTNPVNPEQETNQLNNNASREETSQKPQSSITIPPLKKPDDNNTAGNSLDARLNAITSNNIKQSDPSPIKKEEALNNKITQATGKDESLKSVQNPSFENNSLLINNSDQSQLKPKEDLTEKNKPEVKKEKKSMFSMFKKTKDKSENKEALQTTEKTKVKKAGNTFTKLFKSKSKDEKQEEAKGSLIDAIIESAQDKDEKKTEKKDESEGNKSNFNGITQNFVNQKDQLQESEKKAAKLFSMGKTAVTTAVLFPIISFGVFYSILTPHNFISDSFSANITNYQEETDIKKQLLTETDNRIMQLKRDVKNTRMEIDNLSNNELLADILQQRINWLELIIKIENVANRLFHNDVTKMVTFTNYSGRGSKSEIAVQGFVKDPSGKSFQRLTKLVSELNNHENFSGAEVRNFAKSEDEDGNAVSNFNLQFIYTPTVIEEEEKPKANIKEKVENKESSKKVEEKVKDKAETDKKPTIKEESEIQESQKDSETVNDKVDSNENNKIEKVENSVTKDKNTNNKTINKTMEIKNETQTKNIKEKEGIKKEEN